MAKLRRRPLPRGLRVEVSAQRSLLLPFDQFLFAELTTEGTEQRLRLAFATHQVLVRGHSLGRIETSIQRMDLSFLANVPDRYRASSPASNLLTAS